jgi:Uma2 family endonuclease
VIVFLGTVIGRFAQMFELGRVFANVFEMRLRAGGAYREPDVMVVRREHLDRLTEDRLAGPTDLVIEVISDDSVTRDREEKLHEYQEAGIPEYLIVDPREGQHRLEFFHLNASGVYEAVAADADGRYHSTVLPGFWIDPGWLWQESLPDVDTLLFEIAGDAYVNWIVTKHQAWRAARRNE